MIVLLYQNVQEVMEMILFKVINLNKVWLYIFIVILLHNCNSSHQGGLVSPELNKIAKEIENDKVYKVVEEMPRFPGCENKGISNKNELKNCADGEMVKFIFENIKYPILAKEQLIIGKIIVQFVIGKDGQLENIKMLKDPGGAFENEIKRVLGLMPTWIAGRHKGKPVKVEITLPIRIKPE